MTVNLSISLSENSPYLKSFGVGFFFFFSIRNMYTVEGEKAYKMKHCTLLMQLH